jgi:serine/threonine protein kinase
MLVQSQAPRDWTIFCPCQQTVKQACAAMRLPSGRANPVDLNDSVAEHRNHLALVMEYADGGDMSEAVDRHIIKEVRLWRDLPCEALCNGVTGLLC